MEFRNIKDFEGLYSVNQIGEIKSLIRGIILKKRKTSDGYYTVALFKNKIRTELKEHRIVAEAFLNNPNGLPVVNHKNGVKTDNRVENLEWVTVRENILHYHIKTKCIGASFHKASSKWMARICINGKNKNIGMFKCEMAAHVAYIKETNVNGLSKKYL